MLEYLESKQTEHGLAGRELKSCPQCKLKIWAQKDAEPCCISCIKAVDGEPAALEQADPVAHDPQDIILYGPDGGQHERAICRYCRAIEYRNKALEYTVCRPPFLRKYVWTGGRWRRYEDLQVPHPGRFSDIRRLALEEST